MTLFGRSRIPGRRARPSAVRAARSPEEVRARAELEEAFPDEDLGDEDLRDVLDRYARGSRPRCEEIEYLEAVEEALGRSDSEP